MALIDKLKAIADAIRAKTGQTGTLTLDAMPTAIAGISSGATEPYVEETYDANGNLTAAVLHGHTVVRDKAFSESRNLNSVTIPSSVTGIGNYAFYDAALTAIILPANLQTIGIRAFSVNKRLTQINWPQGLTTIGDYAFIGCTALPSFPTPSQCPGLLTLGESAFRNCPSIVGAITLPAGIEIGTSCFYGDTGLTSVTFLGRPAGSINYAFTNCTNITTINVPWAEGEVANAPWGATNATINYNYTEEEAAT